MPIDVFVTCVGTAVRLRCAPWCVQMALLAKAVLVAVFGSDMLSPGRHGESGLIYLFAAILTSLVCVFVEMLSACALVSGTPTCARPHL